MSKDHQHIDLQLIEKYVSGKMSNQERHLLEKRALEDPFLADALEGFESHPEALQKLKHQIGNQRKANRSFFGSRTLAIIVVASIAYVIAFLFYSPTEEKEPLVNHPTTNIDPKNIVEVEILRPDIDTLRVTENQELSKVEDLKTEQKEILKTESNDSDSSTYTYQEIIEIDENFENINHTDIEAELNNQKITVYAPMTYLSDLYVIDYREIKRSNSNITYTRFELTGISAAFEDSASKNSNDLIEKEVEIPYMEYLDKSMEYFSERRYKKALNRYLTILEQYPKDLNALFYGAHCYYNTSQYNQALAFFQKAKVIEKEHGFVGFKQELLWYEAKTLIKLGERKAALKILDQIIIEGLFYTEQAISLKKNL